jgi:mono/diheme cytochrome c family protein
VPHEGASAVRERLIGRRYDEQDPLQISIREATLTPRTQLAIAVLLGASVSCSAADEASSPAQRGHSLAEALCAGCHAIGSSGASLHIGAPPFRRFDRLLDLDIFMERLREGLMTGHPDMPAFRFTREDARDLVAYLRTVQGP